MNFLDTMRDATFWHKCNTVFDENHPVPTVKHGGGSIMIWGCFAASGAGRLAITDGKMDSTVYQQILDQKVLPSVGSLQLR